MPVDTPDLISIITIALLGSLGHCIGMCGGIVLAYTSSKTDEVTPRITQATGHVLYSFGRVTSYVLLGFIAGGLGSMFAVSPLLESALLGFAALLMVLAGLSILGKIPFLSSIEHNLSRFSWYAESFKSLLRSKNIASFYGLGVLNGFLPCGFVYFFLFSAAATGSVLWGGTIMLIFGISTIPAMFSLGYALGFLQQTHLRKLFIHIAGIAVICFGIYTGFKCYLILSEPQNPSESLQINEKPRIVTNKKFN